jgi:DNA-directed RNA polymerase subunit RPC12/RpoP
VENNFQCSDCHHEFFIPNYSFQISKDVIIYVNPQSKAFITCPQCGSNHVDTVQRSGDLTTVLYGKFSSASDEDKRTMLRKRAKQAMHRDAEQRHEIETKFRGRCEENMY